VVVAAESDSSAWRFVLISTWSRAVLNRFPWEAVASLTSTSGGGAGRSALAATRCWALT